VSFLCADVRGFLLRKPLALLAAAAFALGGEARGATFEVSDELPGGEGARIAAQLREAPPKSYQFHRAALGDVLRMLADDAGISFVSLSDTGIDSGALVTFSLKASPFRALEIVAKSNGIALFHEGGVWYLRPYNDQELIGRTYKLRYNTQETVENTGSSQNSPDVSTGGIGGTQDTGSTQDLGLSLQGATNIFKVNPNPMIKDIKALLGLPTDGLSANLAPEASVDSMTPLDITPNAVKPAGPKTARAVPTGGGAEGGGAQVIWNSDSNTLYVVATRQQHEWVEGYLASVDRPQDLIAIEVKFFETKKDPRKQLGLDWSGTLQEGFTLAARNITASPNGTITLDQRNDHQTQSGTTADGSPPYDYTQSGKVTTATFGAPYSAVLTASNVAATVRAFLQDRDTSTVSYPRVLTLNNREVVIRSVINQPVLASSSSVTPGVGGTTTASVSYLPIGTIINVLPKVLDDGSVMLYVSVTVSSIIGQEPISGNLYPIASSRVYTAELHVNSGYTLAIGGLEEATDERFRNGIPFLKDIPLLGEAFKSNDHRRSRKNLMIFITPTLLGPRTNMGIAEKPQSVIPTAPGEPRPPAFTTDGMLVGGSAALSNAVDWVVRRLEYYRQVVRENRTERKTLEEIAGVITVCGLLQEQIALLKEARPSLSGRYDEQLSRVELTRASLQDVEIKAKKDILRF
jgi:hypothetical protein